MTGALAATAVVVAGVYAVGAVGTTSEENRVWAAAHQQGAPDSCPEREGTYCTAGPDASDRTVMIVGDSHAAQWVPVLSKVAEEKNVRLIIRSLDACPAAEVRVVKHSAPNSECAAFQGGTERLITDIQPDGLLTANSNSDLGQVVNEAGEVPSADEQAALWRAGIASVHRVARDVGAVTATIEDTPRPRGDAAVCVTRPGGNVQNYIPIKAAALADTAELREAERSTPIEYVLSFTDQLCPADHCVISDEGTPVFSDQSHFSQAWAASQEYRIRSLVADALSATPR